MNLLARLWIGSGVRFCREPTEEGGGHGCFGLREERPHLYYLSRGDMFPCICKEAHIC